MAVGKIDKVAKTFSNVLRAQEGTTLTSHDAQSTPTPRVFEGTEEGKAWIITQALQDHPQGVIVGLQKATEAEAGHYVVFCTSPFVNADFPYAPTDTPDDPTRWETLVEAQAAPQPSEPPEPTASLVPSPTKWEKGFRICDPGTSAITEGASVLYKDSYSFVDRSRRLMEAVSIMVVGP